MITSVHRGAREVARLIPEWSELHARDPRANAWSHPAVRLSFDRIFRPGGRPLAITARDESGTLQGLMPLSTRLRRAGPAMLRDLRPLSDWHSCYNDVVANPDLAEQVLRSMAAAINGLEWDALELTRVAEDAWICHETFSEHLPSLRKYSTNPSSLVDLRDGDALLTGSAGTDYRRTLRRLREHGDVQIDWEPRGHAGVQSTRQWLEIHGRLKRHQRQLRVFANRRAEQSFPNWLAQESAAGRAGLWSVRRNGQLLGGCVALRSEGRAYSYRVAWEPEQARFGLGIIILTELMHACRNLGDHTFDLGPGGEAYKRKWRPRIHPCVTLRATRPNWRTRLADRWLQLRTNPRN